MRIEIGIPLLSGLDLAKELIKEAIKLRSPSVIHLSVNEPGREAAAYKSLESMDPRVRVTCQARNLGLYGNFRFLAENAECEQFHWHCFDDQISDGALLDAQRQLLRDDAGLVAIPFVTQECYLDPLRWQGVKSSGNNPRPVSRADRFKSAIYAEPSWIFGLWNAEYLKQVFPTGDFDWLDTYLLQRALLEGRVSCCNTDYPMTIGTWEWKSKVPNAVDGKRHKAYRSILFSGVNFLSNGYLLNKSELTLFVVEARNRMILAKNLTEKLVEERK